MVPPYKVFKDNENGYHAWLEQNPKGFVLNSENPPSAKYMHLHTAECYTINNSKASARQGSFTDFKYMKVCATDYEDLLKWMAGHGATKFTKVCSKCKVADFIQDAGSDGNGWTDEELRASVNAYLAMFKKEQQGQTFSKKQYCDNLAIAYRRSSKAFEYRMQNISYVLSLMGREWLTGFKPARNVGKRLAAKIEALILELKSSPQAPVVAFEMEVRDTLKSLKNKKLPEPEGNIKPAMTLNQVAQYQRDPKVKAWVLDLAKGVCECCGQNAPFEAADGNPFLEVHHVCPLTEGGSDTVSNAVAICPNCHRALHYGLKAKELVEELFGKVTRLVRE